MTAPGAPSLREMEYWDDKDDELPDTEDSGQDGDCETVIRWAGVGCISKMIALLCGSVVLW